MTQIILSHSNESSGKARSILMILIVALALFSRFVQLGSRVMSHDEVNHVVPSYQLYQGQGYQHNPMTHGPFQFHIIALAYFLFGDNDTTSRIPAALFSVGAILFVLLAFPRYLGRNGALIAGALFLISPFMLFYGRYARNEGFIELIGVVLLYGILRYLETGDRLGLFLVTLATALHFVVKETAYIYTALAMIFLFIRFLFETRRALRAHPAVFNRFLGWMSAALLLIFLALGASLVRVNMEKAEKSAPAPSLALPQEVNNTPSVPGNFWTYVVLGSVVAAGVCGAMGLATLVKRLGWQQIKTLRSFGLLLLIGTLILPLLAALPVSLLGWNPLDYSSAFSVLRTGAFILLFILLAAVLGLWWNPALWLPQALLFYAIFTIFYTTFFTNPNGLLSGLVGSLGYWLSQQAEERGNQPLYYYALIQMPLYEFLAGSGTLLAAYFGIRDRRTRTLQDDAPALAPRMNPEENPVIDKQTPPATTESADQAVLDIISKQGAIKGMDGHDFYRAPHSPPVLGLLLFWAAASLVAYSLAGERMPWLTVHIALPCLLAAGWGLGYLVDTTDWIPIFQWKGWLAGLTAPVCLAAFGLALEILFSAIPPFQGAAAEQALSTNRFLLALFITIASLSGILYLLRGWSLGQALRFATVLIFLGMAILTARAAFRAAFVNEDYAYEYLVFAHASPAPKWALQQVEVISRQTAGEKAIQVAYGGRALYPFWWYLRDYPNNRYFGDTPTRDLRQFPVIIVGDDLFEQMQPIVADDYLQFDYTRLWWPNQDYYHLTWERVWGVLANPAMRSAVFQIWLNRDYRAYAALTGQTAQFSPESWNPSERMRLYIRKDTAASMGSGSQAPTSGAAEKADPYATSMQAWKPVQIIGSSGAAPGQFQAPRGLKVAADGSLYVADSRNHRIQHLSTDGSVLGVWGSFADVQAGKAPGGTFNEPWDVAIGKDGSVFVADTWNHRIQKFTADGKFIDMWGYFGQGEQPDAFWGPRGLAIDAQGRLFVVDTGNKRVVVFDLDGHSLTQFGSAGMQPGQFDEPVGTAIDPSGKVYITDTWNQRVQVFSPTPSNGTAFQFVGAWEVAGWAGQSLDNKPYLAIHPLTGAVWLTDPEGPRVLEFNQNGALLNGWGNPKGNEGSRVGLVSGIAVSDSGSVWVSDPLNNCLLRLQ